VTAAERRVGSVTVEGETSGKHRIAAPSDRTALALLERVVDPGTAAEMLRIAVARAGELPPSGRPLFKFLRNELGEALIREIGPRAATTWLEVARASLESEPVDDVRVRVCILESDVTARSSLVRALIREGMQVSFEEAPGSVRIRREIEGWKIEGSAEPATHSIATVVRALQGA
jgi:hypothetical protein